MYPDLQCTFKEADVTKTSADKCCTENNQKHESSSWLVYKRCDEVDNHTIPIRWITIRDEMK